MLPAAAAATPTLHADRACYTEQQPIVLTGGGYTPAGPIRFLGNFTGNTGNANAVPLGSPIAADAAGALSFRLPAPALTSERDIQETLTISANDQAKQAVQPPLPPTEVAASVQVRLTELVETATADNPAAAGSVEPTPASSPVKTVTSV